MNHLALLLSSYLALVGHFQGAQQNVTSSEWASYKLEHGKSYERPEEDAMRRTIYVHSKQWIERHQAEAEARGFSMALNHLADWTTEERDMLNGFRLPASGYDRRNTPEADEFLQHILADNSTEVPDEVDWRKVPGRVSQVKDQGACGSCWAFAAIGALEGQEKPQRNVSTLVELSVQQVLDCSKKDSGCLGGRMGEAFNYVNQQGGLDDEQSYPYHASQAKCSFNPSKVAMSDQGQVGLRFGDEENLKQIVANFGPVSVAIDISRFFLHYAGGIMDDHTCSNSPFALDHAVLIVGYGTDSKGVDYWIVKNSWGPKWGEDGYVRMSRNKHNQCGIATAAVIPKF